MIRLQQDNPGSTADERHPTMSDTNLQFEHGQTTTSVLNFAAATAPPSDPIEPSSNSSLFVVVPRLEYEAMKQELTGLRQAFNELKSSMSYEIQQLKMENKSLKQTVDIYNSGGVTANNSDGTVVRIKEECVDTWTDDAG